MPVSPLLRIVTPLQNKGELPMFVVDEAKEVALFPNEVGGSSDANNQTRRWAMSHGFDGRFSVRWAALALAMTILLQPAVGDDESVAPITQAVAPPIRVDDLEYFHERPSSCESAASGPNGLDNVVATCSPTSVWLAGAEATMLVPRLKGTPAQLVINDLGTPRDFPFSSSAADVDNQMFFGPRVWLGRQGECWGVTGRFWYLNDTAQQLDPMLLAGDLFGSLTSSHLKLYTADIEVQRLFAVRHWQMQGAFGIRYAALEIDRQVNAIVLANPNTLVSSSAITSQQFHGTGLTAALNGLRPITENCQWQWLWSARGSYLWGDATSISQTMTSIVGAGGAGAAANVGTVDNNSGLFIGEVQLGLQYQQRLSCLPANAFVRTGLEYQYWDVNNTGRTTAESFATASGAAATATASTDDQRLHLLGLFLGAGLTF